MIKDKKYRKDRKGKRREREETDKERRERLIPGSSELTTLSKGIVEDDEDERDIDKEVESRMKGRKENHYSEEDIGNALLNISLSIPEKWGQLMTSDPKLQDDFRERLREGKMEAQRELENSAMDDVCGFTRKEFSEFMRRVSKADKRYNGDFLHALHFIMKPLASLISDTDEQDVHLENQSSLRFKGHSRDDVIAACNRHGLRTLEQLLQLISHIQSATKGGLTPKATPSN